MSEPEAPLPDENTAPSAGKPVIKKLKVAGILSTIVFGQCFLVYVLLPSSGESIANASLKTEPAVSEATHHAPAAKEQSEFDLGAFSLTVYNPNTNGNLLVDFHLFGTVTGTIASGGEGAAAEKEPNGEEDDAAKLDKLLKRHKHRFRDHVIATVRNAQMTDLADPGLGLLKRQILTKTNTLLGEPLVKEVIFSDFVVVEQ